jgi:valyl-tRNA synthetase
MEDLAKPAIEAVLGENEDINLFPKKFKNTYRHWMENIRDWNISRQLWWGQQIPAYFYGDGKEDFVVAESREEALKLAQEKTKNSSLKESDLRQDEDALDTWFSSWLWPMSVFDGIRHPENEEIQYYYPTNDLVTGPDILFFWVARMIVAGYEYKDQKPFSNVYLTGLVRDKQRRKMSKSLGNSPDALKLIEDYGADGVRVGLLLSSAAGNDLMFDEALCQQGKGFANKIWNAFRLVKGWQIDASVEQTEVSKIAIDWFDAKFQTVLAEIEDHFSKYRLSDALMAIYKLVWDDFASWFLEMVKPSYGQPIDKKTYDAVIEAFENKLKLLHPFMPFLTEEIWQHITERTSEEALIIAKWPDTKNINEKLIEDFSMITDIVSGIRTIRKEKNISFKDAVELFVINNEKSTADLDVVIQKLTNTKTITYVSEKVDGASFRVKSNEYFVPIFIDKVDVVAEIEKLTIELKRAEGFLFGINKKLSNERFVSNAPEQVIALERKKEADTRAKIETIKSSLDSLK